MPITSARSGSGLGLPTVTVVDHLEPVPARRSDVALLLARGRGLERQRARVDAVPLAGRLGTVVEDVAKVAAAAAAHDLGAPHEQAVVRPPLDRLGDRGPGEDTPARGRMAHGGTAR